MKLTPTAATDFLQKHHVMPDEGSVVGVTQKQYDEVLTAIRKVNPRTDWIELDLHDPELKALIAEIAKADLAICPVELLGDENESEWGISVFSRALGGKVGFPEPKNEPGKTLQNGPGRIEGHQTPRCARKANLHRDAMAKPRARIRREARQLATNGA